MTKPKDITAEEAFAYFVENREAIVRMAPYWIDERFRISFFKYPEHSRAKFKFEVIIFGPVEFERSDGQVSRVNSQVKGVGTTFENAVRGATDRAKTKFTAVPQPARTGGI